MMIFSIAVSCVSMLGSLTAIIYTIRGGHRTSVSEITERVAENTRMNLKLDNILTTVSDINQKIEKIDDSVQKHSEKLIEHEASLKSMHRRIDSLEERLNNVRYSEK